MKNIKIINDVFGIADRIKAIDSKYFVVYNTQKKKFEVHYDRPKNTYELTLPFDCLDARAVFHVQKTRTENRQKIFAEMKLENQKIERENQKKQMELLQRSVYGS